MAGTVSTRSCYINLYGANIFLAFLRQWWRADGILDPPQFTAHFCQRAGAIPVRSNRRKPRL